MDRMQPLIWESRPDGLRAPAMIVAFSGWNDAGDAASGAARWLADRYGAELVATIEAEDFFDFTTTRPIVEIGADGRRSLTWPDTELWAATTDSGTDLVVLVGHEPHLGVFVSWLLTGLQESFVELKKGSACLLEFEKDVKPGRARLLWAMKPGQLRELGK